MQIKAADTMSHLPVWQTFKFFLAGGPRDTCTMLAMRKIFTHNTATLENKFNFFLKNVYLFLERGREVERERERNINLWPLTRPLLGTWPATQANALTCVCVYI